MDYSSNFVSWTNPSCTSCTSYGDEDDSEEDEVNEGILTFERKMDFVSESMNETTVRVSEFTEVFDALSKYKATESAGVNLSFLQDNVNGKQNVSLELAESLLSSADQSLTKSKRFISDAEMSLSLLMKAYDAEAHNFAGSLAKAKQQAEEKEKKKKLSEAEEARKAEIVKDSKSNQSRPEQTTSATSTVETNQFQSLFFWNDVIVSVPSVNVIQVRSKHKSSNSMNLSFFLST